MRKTAVRFTIIFLLAFGLIPAFGQDVSEEAKRHFDRGMAALEMAKSPSDYAAAINEFEQAARLAPDWPAVYYNLGKVQEAAEKYGDAIRSFREYLRLAPDAEDAEEIKSLINKLEYKAEQVLSIPEIIKVLIDFSSRGWKYTYTQRTAGRGCRMMVGEHVIEPSGNDSVKTVRAVRYYPVRYEYQILKVTGPVLKYITTINVCDESINREYNCDSVIENEIEVVSRSLVRLNQTVLRGGRSAGTADGDIYSCTFEKEESKGMSDAGSSAKPQPISPPQDVNAKDSKGRTPLHHAAEFGEKDEVRALIAGGAPVNAQDNSGYTPLHFVEDRDVAELLIAGGALVNAQNNSGYTPLHLVENRDVADLLIAKGADINARTIDGDTPLHSASAWAPGPGRSLEEIVKLLIAKGADRNARNKMGLVPLHFSAAKGRIKAIEALIALGADIKAKDDQGMTALHFCALADQKEAAELLIAKGAAVDARQNYGNTALHIAANSGAIGVVEVLLAHSADANAKSVTGLTPLHRAAKNDHRTVAELLIKKGADVNARNNEGKTPLDLAVEEENETMAELLKKHVAK